MVQSVELHDLLDRCLADGFTPESICKATGTPEPLLEAFRDRKALTREQMQQLDYLAVFLMQLYFSVPDEAQFFTSMVAAIEWYFALPPAVVARYIGVEESVLLTLTNAEGRQAENSLAKQRLLHLFTTLVRDRRHSQPPGQG